MAASRKVAGQLKLWIRRLKYLPLESPGRPQNQPANARPALAGTKSSGAWRSCDVPAAPPPAPTYDPVRRAKTAPPAYIPTTPTAVRVRHISRATVPSPRSGLHQTFSRHVG